jgi:hypothetical protein
MQPAEEAPTMLSADEASDMQPNDDATEQYVEVPVEFCHDGLDNDDDGKVDEECGATTFFYSSPNEEEDKQQSSIDGLEQPSEEYEHSADESEEYESDNETSEEEEHGHED